MSKLRSLDLQISFATRQKELIAGKIKVLSQSFDDIKSVFERLRETWRFVE